MIAPWAREVSCCAERTGLRHRDVCSATALSRKRAIHLVGRLYWALREIPDLQIHVNDLGHILTVLELQTRLRPRSLVRMGIR